MHIIKAVSHSFEQVVIAFMQLIMYICLWFPTLSDAQNVLLELYDAENTESSHKH